MAHALELDEGERQMLLLALAHLAFERPGWDDALNRIAVRIDNVRDGRAVMYDEFNSLKRRSRYGGKLHRDDCALVQSPAGAPCDCSELDTGR